MTSSERLIASEGAPEPTRPEPEPPPIAEAAAGLRAELASLAQVYPECVGLFRRLSEAELRRAGRDRLRRGLGVDRVSVHYGLRRLARPGCAEHIPPSVERTAIT
ncbi:hypothetical protein DB30_06980 [Enhygromyxa salina]|uniref:Uncharacterized protein n=1 Tax=Enhygromyxa salina TaxID=215803 RepID=A0A0C2CST5_9BACT|nr:hypothetical protein DB30_06980 [Enhygromyxa salina]